MQFKSKRPYKNNSDVLCLHVVCDEYSNLIFKSISLTIDKIRYIVNLEN